MDGLEDFSSFLFSNDGRVRTVYRKGEGPAVVVIHEMPGITPEVARFARRVESEGYTVFMPSLFGRDGAPTGLGTLAAAFAQVCISREFALLAEDRPGPVVDWLRALAREAYRETGGRGVGVVGMCLTGNFALTMALDPEVVAPVLAEPSLPFPITARKAAAPHASKEALDNLSRRHEAEGVKAIGLRFKGDKKCPRARFDALKHRLGGAFDRDDLPWSSAANPRRGAHSVLTTELIDREGERTREVLDRVLDYFKQQLKP